MYILAVSYKHPSFMQKFIPKQEQFKYQFLRNVSKSPYSKDVNVQENVNNFRETVEFQ